jgi:energy-coupling factor transport system ATP-binding protein
MKIKMENLSFSYDKKNRVLNNINLEFNTSEIVFILGSTGSGKSTLVSHINGLLFSNEGQVILNDGNKEYLINKKLKDIKNVRRTVGFVFQHPENQLFEKTVLNDVMYGPLNFGATDEGAKEAAVQSLELMDVNELYYDKSPFRLSGGEKRKVAIAGVLSCKPQVFVFDEPTSNLDNKSTRDFFELVKDLKQKGNIVIVISHNENLAYEYADRIIVMSKGNILFDGEYKDAFINKDILEEARIDIPFVCKMKELLKIDDDSRTVKELANSLRGESV